MSGIEVVGLVFGVFPVVISLLEHMRDIDEAAGSLSRFEFEYRKTLESVKHEQDIYQLTLEELLSRLRSPEYGSFTDEDIAELLADPENSLWSGRKVRRLLNDRLGRTSARFLEISRRIHTLISRLLVILVDGKPQLQARLHRFYSNTTGRCEGDENSTFTPHKRSHSFSTNMQRSAYAAVQDFFKDKIRYRKEQAELGLGKAQRHDILKEIHYQNKRLEKLLEKSEKITILRMTTVSVTDASLRYCSVLPNNRWRGAIHDGGIAPPDSLTLTETSTLCVLTADSSLSAPECFGAYPRRTTTSAECPMSMKSSSIDSIMRQVLQERMYRREKRVLMVEVFDVAVETIQWETNSKVPVLQDDSYHESDDYGDVLHKARNHQIDLTNHVNDIFGDLRRKMPIGQYLELLADLNGAHWRNPEIQSCLRKRLCNQDKAWKSILDKICEIAKRLTQDSPDSDLCSSDPPVVTTSTQHTNHTSQVQNYDWSLYGRTWRTPLLEEAETYIRGMEDILEWAGYVAKYQEGRDSETRESVIASIATLALADPTTAMPSMLELSDEGLKQAFLNDVRTPPSDGSMVEDDGSLEQDGCIARDDGNEWEQSAEDHESFEGYELVYETLSLESGPSMQPEKHATAHELLRHRAHRYGIAFKLAAVHLKWDSTWTSHHNWRLDQVRFPLKGSTGDVVEYYTPFLSIDHEFEAGVRTYTHETPGASFWTLGAVLPELCFGRLSETHALFGELDACPDSTNCDLRRVAARDWAEEIELEGGLEYARAVRWCLHPMVEHGVDWRFDFARNVLHPLRACYESLRNPLVKRNTLTHPFGDSWRWRAWG